jgi:hypothetical protein
MDPRAACAGGGISHLLPWHTDCGSRIGRGLDAGAGPEGRHDDRRIT